MPISCVSYVRVEFDRLICAVGGGDVLFAAGLQPARVPAVVFRKVLVAVEAFGGFLGPYAVADRPPEGFHEGDASGDDAKVDLEAIPLVSHDELRTSSVPYILAKAFPIPTP